MAKTIVGLFDTFTEAQGAVQELVNKGFPRDNISIAANNATGEYVESTASEEWSGTATGATTGAAIGGIGGLLVGLGALAIPGIGPVVAAGPLIAALTGAGVGAVAGGLIGALTDIGVPEEEAGYYAEGVRRGGTLVTINAEDSMADQAIDILEDHNAVDVEQRASSWKQSGWTDYSPTAQPYTKDEITLERERYRTTPTAPAVGSTATSTQSIPSQQARRDISATGGKETTLPVIEEEMQIGKRSVSRGGVRVYSRVTEKPVEEQVQLRKEQVSVERRPVNRAVSGTDRDAFKEGTIEMTETSEEAVVSKQARVVEEVVVRKDAQERTETVRDTVRRTDVEVEKLGAKDAQGKGNFDAYDADFRKNFTSTYGSKGKNYTYEKYMPAYRYGYDLTNDNRYSGKDWSAFESDARRDWETRYSGQGVWEDVKDAVRYAWDSVRGREPRRV